MEDYMADNAIQEDLNLPDMPEGDWMEGSAAAANEEDPAQEQLEEEAPPHQEELTQTQAFSRRLREMSSREVDNFVSGLGWTNDITGEPIRTREDFTRYQSMLAAKARGSDPVLSAQMEGMERDLSTGCGTRTNGSSRTPSGGKPTPPCGMRCWNWWISATRPAGPRWMWNPPSR